MPLTYYSMLITDNREVGVHPARSSWGKNLQAEWATGQGVLKAPEEGELSLADVCQECPGPSIPGM